MPGSEREEAGPLLQAAAVRHGCMAQGISAKESMKRSASASAIIVNDYVESGNRHKSLPHKK